MLVDADAEHVIGGTGVDTRHGGEFEVDFWAAGTSNQVEPFTAAGKFAAVGEDDAIVGAKANGLANVVLDLGFNCFVCVLNA